MLQNIDEPGRGLNRHKCATKKSFFFVDSKHQNNHVNQTIIVRVLQWETRGYNEETHIFLLSEKTKNNNMQQKKQFPVLVGEAYSAYCDGLQIF